MRENAVVVTLFVEPVALATPRRMRAHAGAQCSECDRGCQCGRWLQEEGKVWCDDLASMIGSDITSKATAFAKQGGKPDAREFGLVPRSGGFPASGHRGKGPRSGGYLTPSPIPKQPLEEPQWCSSDTAEGSSKIRRTGYAPHGVRLV